MKKNPEFERWIADHLMNGMIILEPYGYREDEPGNYLHIFRINLQFEDEPAPFEGVAFIPIPFKQDDAYDPLQDEYDPLLDEYDPLQDEYDPLQNSDFFDIVQQRDYYEDWFDPLCERKLLHFDPCKPIW